MELWDCSQNRESRASSARQNREAWQVCDTMDNENTFIIHGYWFNLFIRVA